MSKKISKILTLVFALVFIWNFSFSQLRETGSIQGYVIDDQNQPLPGVTITVSSPKLIGGERSRVTDIKGFYKFPALSPGEYTVKAKLEGFNTMVREGIRVVTSQTMSADFVMTPATVSEEIVVTAEAPTLDVQSSSTSGVVMSTELLTSTPMPKSLVGLIMQGGGGTDPDFQSAYGMDMTDNSWTIDGISANGKILGGGTTFRPDFNTIQEAAVEGIGLPAEYGGFTGTVISVVTKTGSNAFHGFNEIVYNGKNWNSQNRGGLDEDDFVDPTDKQEKYSTPLWFDIGAQVGGKLIYDRLWFFASGEYSRSKSWIWDTYEKARYLKGFSKLTWQANNSNRFNLAFNMYDRYINPAPIDPLAAADIFLIMDRQEWTLNMTWTSIFSQSTYLDAKFGYYRVNSDTQPGKGLDVVGGYDLITYAPYDNYPYFNIENQNTLQANIHLSYYIPDFIGSHDLKIGAEYEGFYHKQFTGYPGGASVYYLFGQPDMKMEQEPITKDYKIRTTSVFAQDSWRVNKRLTLNLGLRFERYWFKFPEPSQLGVAYDGTSLAPRIGFAYDLLGDRKNIIKGHFGKYYSTVAEYFFRNADDRANPSTTYLWLGFWYELYTQTFFQRYSVDPDLKQPHVKEWTFSFERELFKQTSLSITAFYKKSYDFVCNVNYTGEFVPTQITNPGRDGVVGTADDSPMTYYLQTNPGDNFYIITNPKKGEYPSLVDDFKRISRGFEITLHKRLANRWQMILSYTYMDSKGNTQRMWTSALNPNIFTNAYGSYWATGQPHALKLTANVILPLDISLGVFSYITSGWSYGIYGWFYYRAPDVGFSRLTGEPPGTTKGETRKNLDIKLEKRFKMGGVTLSAMADIYNVFNFGGGYILNGIYGSNFGKISSALDPRSFRIGFRVVY